MRAIELPSIILSILTKANGHHLKYQVYEADAYLLASSGI